MIELFAAVKILNVDIHKPKAKVQNINVIRKSTKILGWVANELGKIAYK